MSLQKVKSFIKPILKPVLGPVIAKIRKLRTRGKKPVLEFDKDLLSKIIVSKNPVIMEIGCANGKDTLEFLKQFSSQGARFFGFEPEPKNIKLIKENIHDPRFTLFEGAVSDINGKVQFNRSRTKNPDDLSLSGSIVKPKNHLKEWDWIYFDEMLEVSTITLDTFVQKNNIGIIDFVWCDVQGAEEKVIRGGKETFEKKIKYFFTEYSNKEYYENQPTLKRILKLLPNYEIVKDYGSDILLRNKNVL